MASNRPELSLLAVSAYVDDSDSSDVDSDTDSSSSDSDVSITDVLSAPDVSSSQDSGSDDSSSDGSSSGDDSSTASSESRNTNTLFYKSAHWTSDGTTIITSSWNNKICSFVIPEDLLEPRDQPLALKPQTAIQLAEPTNVCVSAPYYDIRYDNTNHILVASEDHPIQLYQTGIDPPGGAIGRVAPAGSYHFTSPTTEAYYSIHSLLWSPPGSHFYVGARDLIAQFDTARHGEGPAYVLPTIPSRRHIRKGNGIGMRGTVSALSEQTTEDGVPTGLIAAGTWTRCVGIYDLTRSGDCTATWSIEKAAEAVVHTEPPAELRQSPLPREWRSARGTVHPIQGIAGSGIIQTAWSPCGRYLILNERYSTGMLVYDVRGTNKVLGFLAGRDARTHQRMSCDVFRGADDIGGFEVWAGAMDGTVKVWEGVGNTEGCQWPSWDFSAADRTQGFVAPALGSVGLHHSGSVVVTCAGSWLVPGDQEARTTRGEASPITPDPAPKPQDRKMEGSSLKLWRIGASGVSYDDRAATGSKNADTPMSEAANIVQLGASGASDDAEAVASSEHADTSMEGSEDMEQLRQIALAELRDAETMADPQDDLNRGTTQTVEPQPTELSAT